MGKDIANQNRHQLWLAAAVAFAIVALASWLSGLTLSSDSLGKFWLYLSIVIFAWRIRPNEFGRIARLIYAADALLSFTVISALGAIGSYVAMRHSGPLTDSLLDGLDKSLGLDWWAIRTAVEQNSALLEVLTISYFACFALPMIVITILSAPAHINGSVRV